MSSFSFHCSIPGCKTMTDSLYTVSIFRMNKSMNATKQDRKPRRKVVLIEMIGFPISPLSENKITSSIVDKSVLRYLRKSG